jgi:DUF4097 and DUF4098 domain-containing protein YvlB
MLHLFTPLIPSALSLVANVTPVARQIAPLASAFDTTVAVMSATNLALELRTGGSVKITGSADKVVRIHVTEGGRPCADCRVEFEQSAQTIQLRSNRGAVGALPSQLSFEIEVPRHFDLDVSSAGGDVQIEGVDGVIKGQTQSGALTLRRLSGTVDLQTMRGDVSLRESYVSGRVRTVGGKVLMEDVTGAVEGSSEDGKVIKRRVSAE